MTDLKNAYYLIVAMVLALALTATAGGPGTPGKEEIIIEWGGCTLDTVYLRRNTEQCENLPVNGLATWACWPRSEVGRLAIKPVEKKFDEAGRELPLRVLPSGQTVGDYHMGRRVMGHDRIPAENCTGAIQDLKATKFKRFNHMVINVLMGNLSKPLNWYDDEHWKTICHNIAMIARLAKQGGCKGIFIDPEIYGHSVIWTFNNLGSDGHSQQGLGPGVKGLPEVYAGKSWKEVAAKVKQRGQEFMKAIESEYPAPTIWFAMGYGVSARQSRSNPRRLKTVSYGLLPAFMDGMLEASSPGTIIVDGNETSYGHKTAEQFRRTRRACVEGGLKITLCQNPCSARKCVWVSVYGWISLGDGTPFVLRRIISPLKSSRRPSSWRWKSAMAMYGSGVR